MTAFIWGMFAFAIVRLITPVLGLEFRSEWIVAVVSGGVVGVLFFRERGWTETLKAAEESRLSEIGELNSRVAAIYSSPVCALVVFDPGDFTIHRTSGGFRELVGLGTDRALEGAGLDEVLEVDSLALADFVRKVRESRLETVESLVRRPESENPVHLTVGHAVLLGDGSVELSLGEPQRKDGNLAELERSLADLERFQAGMVRREYRILELKGEVNELLHKSGQPLRYQVDDKREEKKLPDAPPDRVGEETS